MTQSDSLTLLNDLVSRAKKAGADAADALAVEGTSMSVAYRLGHPEKVERAEGNDLALRVFVGKRQAIVSSSDRSAKALNELLDRAMAMARTVPEDPFAGLASPDEIAQSLPDLDLFDTDEPSSERLVELARSAEDAARAVTGVTNSEGAEAGWGGARTALVASNGFAHEYRTSGGHIAVSVLAGDAGGMERDDDWSYAVHMADLREAGEIGTSAGQRAVRRLGSKKPPTAHVPVVFDPRVARSLLGHLAGAINGSSIARGTSFLKESLGKAIMPKGLSVIDDPHRQRGLRSRPCDGEGVANTRRAIVDDGVLTTWFMDLRSARQLKMKSTGHAARGTSSPPSPSPSNLWIEPGALTAKQLIGEVKSGLYVTELIGQGVNGITGDYSRGAAGFWIENGELTYPVSEVTVASNLKDMLLRMTAANDLAFRTGMDTPTLRIDGMTLAGS
ncbi:MAG TPA: metallopeptidase TldD-related protein [Magnetospirillaceae bacterium]|jgi:PmbA protein